MVSARTAQSRGELNRNIELHSCQCVKYVTKTLQYTGSQLMTRLVMGGAMPTPPPPPMPLWRRQ